jgi:hypothetical protein
MSMESFEVASEFLVANLAPSCEEAVKPVLDPE